MVPTHIDILKHCVRPVNSTVQPKVRHKEAPRLINQERQASCGSNDCRHSGVALLMSPMKRKSVEQNAGKPDSVILPSLVSCVVENSDSLHLACHDRSRFIRTRLVWPRENKLRPRSCRPIAAFSAIRLTCAGHLWSSPSVNCRCPLAAPAGSSIR